MNFYTLLSFSFFFIEGSPITQDKKHKDILILKSDKSTGMKNNDYLHHYRAILNDEKYYKVIHRDPTTPLQSKSNKIINKLNKKSYITIRLNPVSFIQVRFQNALVT